MKLVKDFVLPTAVLTIICLVVSAALSVTYGITNPIIEENSRRQAQEALMEVLPEADSFTETTDALPEGVLKLYTAQNGVGKVVQTSVSGYGGAVVVMTGVKTDGTVPGVKVLQNSEAGSWVRSTPPSSLGSATPSRWSPSPARPFLPMR